MDDKPKNEEPKKEFNTLDLSQLESFSFGTQWTQDKQQPGESGSQRRESRQRREGGPEVRKDRRGFKRPNGPVGPGSGGGGPAGDRPRSEHPRGRGQGGQQGRGHERGGDAQGRFQRGGDRRFGGGNRPPPPYVSPYFDVTFYPEDVSFAALAKTIRASCRTFELFDIAKTVIGKHDRFVVVIERKSNQGAKAEKRPFFVSVPDGLPFETEDAAFAHVMQNHVEQFFDASVVETDPPKGSFQVINKCGVTGELLGPPNYHLYTQIIQHHHASRLANMPFDVFRDRIVSVREQEVVDAWLESMKKVTRYTWKLSATAPAKVQSDEKSESASPSESSEVPSPGEPTENSPESTEDNAETPPAAEGADEKSSAGAADAPSFDTLSEAKVYLLTQARDKAVRAYETGRFHGRALDNLPDGEIKRAVLGTLERQQRFPLDTANALRGRLRREGFTIFKKGSKGVSYVCAVKRKFRVPGQTFADTIGELISFIEAHPMVKVSELPVKMLEIQPPADASSQEKGEATAPIEMTEEAQRRVKRMHADLRWLVTEGYVTEFIDGSVFASPPLPEPKPKKAPASHDKPSGKTVSSEPPKPAETAETTETAETATDTEAGKSEEPTSGDVPAADDQPDTADEKAAPVTEPAAPAVAEAPESPESSSAEEPPPPAADAGGDATSSDESSTPVDTSTSGNDASVADPVVVTEPESPTTTPDSADTEAAEGTAKDEDKKPE